MPGREAPQASYRKSTYSDGGNGCVEVATLSTACLVRDSEDAE